MERRTVRAIVAAVLIIVGAVWVFQGVGALGGSPMTGVTFWAWAGVATVIAGIVLAVRGFRSR